MTKEQKFAISLGVCGFAILVTSLSKSWFTIGSGGIGPSGVEFCSRGRCSSVPWSVMTGSDGIIGIGSDVPVAATIGMIAAIVAAAGVIGAGVLVWMKNMLHRVPIRPTQIALGVATFGCTFMEVRLLTLRLEYGVKGSLGLAAIVCIAAIATAAILLRKLAPSVAMAKAHAPPPSQLLGGQPYGGPPMGLPPTLVGGQPAPVGGQPGQFGGQPPMGWPQQMGTAPTMAVPGGPGVPAAQTGSPCPRCQRPLVFVAQYQRWFCEPCKQYA